MYTATVSKFGKEIKIAASLISVVFDVIQMIVQGVNNTQVARWDMFECFSYAFIIIETIIMIHELYVGCKSLEKSIEEVEKELGSNTGYKILLGLISVGALTGLITGLV